MSSSLWKTVDRVSNVSLLLLVPLPFLLLLLLLLPLPKECVRSGTSSDRVSSDAVYIRLSAPRGRYTDTISLLQLDCQTVRLSDSLPSCLDLRYNLHAQEWTVHGVPTGPGVSAPGLVTEGVRSGQHLLLLFLLLLLLPQSEESVQGSTEWWEGVCRGQQGEEVL